MRVVEDADSVHMRAVPLDESVISPRRPLADFIVPLHTTCYYHGLAREQQRQTQGKKRLSLFHLPSTTRLLFICDNLITNVRMLHQMPEFLLHASVQASVHAPAPGDLFAPPPPIRGRLRHSFTSRTGPCRAVLGTDSLTKRTRCAIINKYA